MSEDPDEALTLQQNPQCPMAFCSSVFLPDTNADNPDDPTDLLQQYISPESLAKYVQAMTYKKEKCPNTGKAHYQLTCELKERMRIKAVQKHIFGGLKINIQKRKGTWEQAETYCLKTETAVPGTIPFVYGTPKTQGARTDKKPLDEVLVDVFVHGKPLYAIADESQTKLKTVACNERQLRFAQTLRMEKMAAQGEREVTSYVIYGSTRVGKSLQAQHLAHSKYQHLIDSSGEPYVMRKPDRVGGLWWFGYNGERIIVFEDFNGDWIPLNNLLGLMDRQRMPVSVKNGNGYLPGGEMVMIFTANTDPATWYPNEDEELRLALMARFTNLMEFRASAELKDAIKHKASTLRRTVTTVTPSALKKSIETHKERKARPARRWEQSAPVVPVNANSQTSSNMLTEDLLHLHHEDNTHLLQPDEYTRDFAMYAALHLPDVMDDSQLGYEEEESNEQTDDRVTDVTVID